MGGIGNRRQDADAQLKGQCKSLGGCEMGGNEGASVTITMQEVDWKRGAGMGEESF